VFDLCRSAFVQGFLLKIYHFFKKKSFGSLLNVEIADYV